MLRLVAGPLKKINEPKAAEVLKTSTFLPSVESFAGTSQYVHPEPERTQKKSAPFIHTGYTLQ